VFGHLNPATFNPQAILAILAAIACCFSRRTDRFVERLTSWPVLLILFLIALWSVPMMVVGYIAPCGAVQDTAGAGELLAGRSAYPRDMSAVVKQILQTNPLPATPSWLRKQQSAHLDCLYELELNAHPPLVAVGLKPVVAAIGYFKPILIFHALSITSMIVMIWLSAKALGIALTSKFWLVNLLLLFGSAPVFDVFRDAGMSALLAFLVVATWYLLRTERDSRAGVILGIATGLKIFPIVACGAMLFGRMRALLATFGTLIVILLGIVFLQGTSILTDYAATAHVDAMKFRALRNNFSLYANIYYLVHRNETLFTPALVLIYGALGVIAAFVVFRLRNSWPVCCDFAMALAATLMCLLPPVVWIHYFVILYLPLIVISRYAKWWESRAMTVVFLVVVAVLNQGGGFMLNQLMLYLHTDVVWSLPTLGVLTIFGWLCVKGLQIGSPYAESPTVPLVRKAAAGA
jgi:hypothetical protein